MKKQIALLATAFMLCSTAAVYAQAPDVENPLLKYTNRETGLTFTAGARLMADVAYYHSDFTPMKSGAAITDARIRASLKYKQFYFYGDFDFSGGRFTQKDLFLRYNLRENARGIHSLKAGYYAEPTSMSMQTSRYAYHFVSRPSPVQALAPGRALGFTYKFFNTALMLEQGLFAENRYNNQTAGNQGISVGGRWVWKAINNKSTTLHIGATARYAQMNTGVVTNNIFTTHQVLSAPMQTSVDPVTRYLNADLPWARKNLNLGGEALLRTNRFFARGEYLFKRVYKQRPDQEIFVGQLGGVWSWTTLESWQKGNPLRTSNFDGAYLELGYLLKGAGYTYNDEGAQLGGMSDKSWEVVARYSYTNLNDINKGDYFLIGRNQFYPGGTVSDYPAVSTSVGGGRMHAATVGLNYSPNAYLKFLAEYQFARLNNVYFPMDKAFHTVQMKVMFSF